MREYIVIRRVINMVATHVIGRRLVNTNNWRGAATTLLRRNIVTSHGGAVTRQQHYIERWLARWRRHGNAIAG